MRTHTTTSLLCLFAGICLAAPSFVGSATDVRTVLNAGDFAGGDPLTGGIQAAIDSLPEGGGTVYVPAGTYPLHRPVKLRPGVKLVGAGKGSILKKDDGFVVGLAEDAEKGQGYVVVEDASRLREGGCIAIGDKKHPGVIWGGMFLITALEGNKVSISHILSRGGLRSDLAVADGGCCANLFMVILPAPDATVMDLQLDGNKANQVVDFATESKIFPSYGMLWCGLYPARGVHIERCDIHDCGIGIHINGGRCRIRNCDIHNNSADGIHAGGGPRSMIVNNRIFDNGAMGVSFCYGNKYLNITGNEIFRNRLGIGAIGIGKNEYPSDRWTLISNNIIYENEGPAICSGQGHVGPVDCVFSGNLMRNNVRGRSQRYAPGGGGAPAGMFLYNARNCVVANNRSFDDRGTFTSAQLSDAVEAGVSEIHFRAEDGMVLSTYDAGDWIKIETDRHSEIKEVAEQTKGGLALSEPLVHSYPAGATVRELGAQKWGILVLGDESEGNVVQGNVCAGNGVGGIMISYPDKNTVKGNAGTVEVYDENKLPIENLMPPLKPVDQINGSFESADGWNLQDGVSCLDSDPQAGRTGTKALKLTRAENKGVADATSKTFVLEPNRRYRLSAWVRSNAKQGGREALPYLFAWMIGGKGQLGWRANTLGYSHDPHFGGVAKPAPREWIRIGMEFVSPSQPTEVQLYCRLSKGVGDAWVDDVVLDVVEEFACGAGGSTDALLKVPYTADAPTIDGLLDDPAWKEAARVAGFFRSGRSARASRNVLTPLS